jgi:hypothetical protein
MKRSRLAQIHQLRAEIASLARDGDVDGPLAVEARLHLHDAYMDYDMDLDDGSRLEKLAFAELVAAFESRLRRLGPDHPDTLAMQYRVILEQPGVNAWSTSVVAALEELATAQERVLGPHHPSTLATLAQLWPGKTPSEQAALDHRIRRGWAQLLAERDPQFLEQALLAVAAIYETERPEQACQLREQAIDVRARVAAELSDRLGPVHPETVHSRVAHANLYAAFDAARSQEATRMIEQIVADHQRILGMNHPRTLHADVELARHYGWSDPRCLALSESLIDRLYAAAEPNYDDIKYIRHLLAAHHARTEGANAIHAFHARYPVPDDADDHVLPGTPDYSTIDDDL